MSHIDFFNHYIILIGNEGMFKLIYYADRPETWSKQYNIASSGLAYEMYSGGCSSTYVYYVVCYRVIADPYVRSVGHVFAYLYILDDDSERLMEYDTSLLRKVFPMGNLFFYFHRS